MTPLDASILGTYYLALAILAVYGVHRFHLVRLRRRHAATRPAALEPEAWPSLTVQLPLYNEPNVAARLLDAVSRFDYPGALDIQVLDDSTDDTPRIVAERVAQWQALGVRIAHVRRGSRDGYKAGALAHGMRLSDAEMFAVFDADFVPAPDTLRRMVPHLLGDGVGMVQARWTHLNRRRSMLTRVQAIYLDGHFAIESAARHFSGRFFNFNGTAGIWRREAIEDAGGWSASTLTEDLDLSYRSQLAGWKFVFLPDVEVPAELPSALSGFQEQQHRWTKGSVQTARKILPQLMRSKVAPMSKAEACFHLTGNAAYVLSLIVALLMVPAIVIRQRLGIAWTFSIDALIFATSTCSVLLFYIEGQRFANQPRPTVRELLAVLPIGVGISIRNSVAVMEGLFETGGHFNRTPKEGEPSPGLRLPNFPLPVTGEGGRRPGEGSPPRLPLGEIVLALFFAGATAAFVTSQQWLSLPFLLIFLSGYSYVACRGVSERLSY
jgi:cellulose synthase/poly-beta-1,6-N-acetylglucosamine synthase-like glycosyltransferase